MIIQKRNVLFLFVLFSTIIFGTAQAQTSIHSLTIKLANDSSFAINNCKGKTLMIIIVDANQPDLKFLKLLDSVVYRQKGKLVGVIVPATDLSAKKDVSNLFKLLSATAPQFKIATYGLAKKTTSTDIGVMLQWLTNKDSNKHFNASINEQNHLFLIDKSGGMFASIAQANLMKHEQLLKILSVQ